MREIKFRAIEYTAETFENAPWATQHYIKTENDKGYLCQGYVMRKVKNHIYANKRGYVAEHRLEMEAKLGRFLIPRKELVHHIDGNRSNNSPSNLKLTSPTEHPKGHIGERNSHGQFVCQEPIFKEIKIRLLDTSTGIIRPYTLQELISTTYRRGQFKYRGRFTGLKDKNGVEIYEGDIVKTFFDWRWWVDDCEYTATGYCIGVVTITATRGVSLRNPTRVITEDDDETRKPVYKLNAYEKIVAYRSEVIDNIWENPELLEA